MGHDDGVSLLPASHAFLAAAAWAETVLADPALGAAWERPSALAHMDVGTVAGHLYLVVRRVDKHLDAEPSPVLTPTGHYQFIRVSGPADHDQELHQQVRRDGRHVARWGWESVRDAFEQRVRKLESRMTGALPATIQFGAGSLDFGEYLHSRVVEVLVHTDDLAVSVGIDPGVPPTECTDVALPFLLQASRELYGDLGVVRAFTRRERAEGSAPAVF